MNWLLKNLIAVVACALVIGVPLFWAITAITPWLLVPIILAPAAYAALWRTS